jgi:hypothetical protein
MDIFHSYVGLPEFLFNFVYGLMDEMININPPQWDI